MFLRLQAPAFSTTSAVQRNPQAPPVQVATAFAGAAGQGVQLAPHEVGAVSETHAPKHVWDPSGQPASQVPPSQPGETVSWPDAPSVTRARSRKVPFAPPSISLFAVPSPACVVSTGLSESSPVTASGSSSGSVGATSPPSRAMHELRFLFVPSGHLLHTIPCCTISGGHSGTEHPGTSINTPTIGENRVNRMRFLDGRCIAYRSRTCAVAEKS
jgi:hypothetical protein